MHIDVVCKGCGRRYRVNASLAGRVAACKHCGQRFTVPYRSAVVELGDEQAVKAAEDAVERSDGGDGGGVNFDDPSVFALAEKPVEQAAPARPRAGPAIPEVLTEVWIPLIVVALAAGCAGYAAVTRAIHTPNPIVTFALIGLGLALYVLLAMPLTLRGLQAAGDSLGYELPNALWLQTLAAFAVPTAAMVLGYFNAGARGAVVGGVVGLLLVWPLMFLMYRLRVLAALSAALAGAICYVFALGIVTAAVAGASGLISLAGLTLPWQEPEKPAVVATPEPAPKTPAAVPKVEPAPVVVVDKPVAERATLALLSPTSPLPGLEPAKVEPPWAAAVDAPPAEPAWPASLHHIIDDLKPPVIAVRPVPWGPVVCLIDRDSCDVYELRGKRRIGFIKQAMHAVGTMKLLSPDGAHLIIDRTAAIRALEVWSTKDGRVESKIDANGAGAAVPEPIGFVGNDQLAVIVRAGARSTVQVFAAKNGAKLQELNVGQASATALSPTGKFLAVAQGNRVHVYDLSTGTAVGEREIPGLPAHWFAPPALCFSRDGGELLALVGDPAAQSARLVAWNTSDGKVVREVKLPGASVAEIECLPHGNAIRIGGELFDSVSGGKYHTIQPPAAGRMSGTPRRMLSDLHVLQEFMPAGGNGDKVIYKSQALPKGEIETALRAMRPAEPVVAGDKIAPATAPAAQAASPETEVAQEKLNAGLTQLDAGRDREAQQLFSDGIAAYGKAAPPKLDDDTRINLYHALAVAHVRLDEIPKARQAMERVRGATRTNRSIALNEALLDILTKQNIVRGLNTLEKQLGSGEVEEDVVNLYGVAVSKLDADASTRRGAQTWWDKYHAYESRLTPPSPGVRRWGSRWLTAVEWQPIEARRRDAESAKARLRQQVSSLEASLGPAKTRAAAANAAYQTAREQNIRDDRLPRLSREATAASAEVSRINREIDRAREQLHKSPSGPKPTFDPPKGFTPSLELQLK